MSIDIDPNRLSTYLEGKYDWYKTANTKFKKELPKVIRTARIVTAIAAGAAGILADRYNTSIATPTSEKPQQAESVSEAQATTVDASDEISASLISSHPEYAGRNIQSTRIIVDGIQSDIASVPLTETEALAKEIPPVMVDTDGDGILDTTVITEQNFAYYIKPFDDNPSDSKWTDLFGIKFELTDGTIVTQMDILNSDGTFRNVLTYTENQNEDTLKLIPLVNYPTVLNSWDGATPITIYSVGGSERKLFEDISYATDNNIVIEPTVAPVTVAPTLIPEATVEAPYHININPENISGAPLTLQDVQGPLTDWTNTQSVCINTQLDSINNPALPVIIRVGDVPSLGLHILQPKSIETDSGRIKPKIAQICSFYKINPSAFGFNEIPRSDIYLITEVMEDAKGNRGTWQLITGQAGIDSINSHGSSSVNPYDILKDTARNGLLSGKTGGQDDARIVGEDDLFYESQGTNREQVLAAFEAFASGGYDAPFDFYKDKAQTVKYKNVREFIETHVFRCAP